MNPGTIRIDTYEFFRRVRILYKWELTEKEKEIMYQMAKEHGAGLILENWELFQNRNPGHPAWDFQEWYTEEMNQTQEENCDSSK